MRKKNPGIQKWVNSIQHPEQQSSTGLLKDETTICNSINNIEIDQEQPNVLTTSKPSELTTTSEDPPRRHQESISIKRIFERYSKSSDHLDINDKEAEQQEDEEENNKKKSSYFNSGKIKINDFYEKLSLNKSRYNIIKARKMDIKEKVGEFQRSLSQSRTSSEKLPEADLETIFHLEEDDIENSKPSDIKTYKDEENEKDVENLEKITKQPKISDIGRSRSENPSSKKRYNLQDIGRSFSEMKDDENIENIERINNTYPISSSLNTSSTFTLSTQNMFAKSVPVSPIPRKECTMRRRQTLMKDSSIQSDSSHCSSVESLLNARKPDPEMILVNLGFGPANTSDVLSKIPKRFLKPSKVRGIDTEAFLRQQQLSVNIHENSVLGYRGLVGNPHLAPSSVVANIMRRFEYREKMLMYNRSQSQPVYSNPSSPLPRVQSTES